MHTVTLDTLKKHFETAQYNFICDNLSLFGLKFIHLLKYPYSCGFCFVLLGFFVMFCLFVCLFVCFWGGCFVLFFLTHWGRVTHICVSKLTIIDSDNGLSLGRRQAIIRTNAGILLIRTLGTNSSEILSAIHAFSFKKIHLKMSSAKWRLFRLDLNELIMISPASSHT